MSNKLENADKESNRLSELRKYGILDTLSEVDYDNITQMASIICDVPIALISFVDEKRQWFKSHKGLPIAETPREYSFCAHALDAGLEMLIIPDSREDARFYNNPFVTGDPNIVFYAGVSLVSSNGYALGTVCVIDNRPRELSASQLSALKILSSQVINLLELRKRNADLSTTSQRLQLALTAGKLGSYDLNLQSGAMITSAQCRENFGFDDNELFNYEALLSRILPEDLPSMQLSVKKSLDNNIAYDAQYRIKLRSGEVRWIHASGLPVYNDLGDPVQMTGVILDVTEQKTFTSELEKKVVERTNELNRKNIDLANMNKELQSFAYVSSHDLQEPLRKIQTFSERIVNKFHEGLHDDAKDYFARIQAAAGRMQNLINDLLSYSRTNISERIYLDVDLSDIVELVKKDLGEELQHAQATIVIGKLNRIKIIPFQFRQLLQNLFSNSIKFCRPDMPLLIMVDSKIDMGLQLHQEHLNEAVKYHHLSISDNGIGFDQQYSEKIFDLFERLNGRYEYEGTGIGLAIVKKIVENHNGIVTAKSELGKGATFDIYIPIDSNAP